MLGIRMQASGGRRPIGFLAARRCVLAATMLACVLGGCSGLNTQSVPSAMITPGKYEFQDCPAIAATLRARQARLLVLEKLMADASKEAGGGVVSAMAYRPEYASNQGEIDELTRATGNKNCTVQSPFSSGRAVF
jgi:hypothetical protein